MNKDDKIAWAIAATVSLGTVLGSWIRWKELKQMRGEHEVDRFGKNEHKNTR